jgi:glycosyltransferase involved in cell wall biosynthesis
VASPNDQPTVSVVIPCYNQGRYLAEALHSVIGQSYARWRCTVINDGSTDHTREVALEFAKQDGRIQYVEQQNRGLAAARNRGLDEIGGEYVQFLDADDILLSTKFERQLAALERTQELALAYSDYRHGHAEDMSVELEHEYLSPKLSETAPLLDLAGRWETEIGIPTHCFLFDARFFRSLGVRFDERLASHEDWDCWLRIFAMKPAVFYVDRKLAVYRMTPHSMCKNMRAMENGFVQAIRKQQELFAGDRALQACLGDKISRTRSYYRRRRRERLTAACNRAWAGIRRGLDRHLLWRLG